MTAAAGKETPRVKEAPVVVEEAPVVGAAKMAMILQPGVAA